MFNDIIATIVAIAMSIGGAFSDLANFLTPHPPPPAPTGISQSQPQPSIAANIDPFHSELSDNDNATSSDREPQDVSPPPNAKPATPSETASDASVGNQSGRVLGESTSNPLPHPRQAAAP